MGVSRSFNAPAQRMHKVPTVPVENNRREIFGLRFGKGRRTIGRAERCDCLPDASDVLEIAYAAAMRRDSIGQAQTAQGDCRAGDQWARNTFDPSLRLGRR